MTGWLGREECVGVVEGAMRAVKGWRKCEGSRTRVWWHWRIGVARARAVWGCQIGLPCSVHVVCVPNGLEASCF